MEHVLPMVCVGRDILRPWSVCIGDFLLSLGGDLSLVFR